MLTEERHAFILQRLHQNGTVKLQELMDMIGCSESTVRRDLGYLESIGELKRVHGGAQRIYQLDEELTSSEKSFKNIHEKEAIGKKAASLVEHHSFLFMDAGTTTLAMIPYLQDQSITVVTNGVPHASLLADQQIKTFLLGGEIKLSTKAIIGAVSLNELNYYRFDQTFLGMNGMDPEFGCTTPDPEEAALKRKALQRAAATYLLADQSKWSKVSFAKVCDMTDLSIVTDQLPAHFQYCKEKTTILEAEGQ